MSIESKYGVSYKDNPKEYRRLQALERRKKHPVRYLLNQVRYRCKIKGMEFDLTEDDLPVPALCPILQIPLKHSLKKRDIASYSIDRVDNSKGYVKGNCRVISFGANIRKGDMTIEQVERLLAYMKGEI